MRLLLALLLLVPSIAPVAADVVVQLASQEGCGCSGSAVGAAMEAGCCCASPAPVPDPAASKDFAPAFCACAPAPASPAPRHEAPVPRGDEQRVASEWASVAHPLVVPAAPDRSAAGFLVFDLALGRAAEPAEARLCIWRS